MRIWLCKRRRKGKDSVYSETEGEEAEKENKRVKAHVNGSLEGLDGLHGSRSDEDLSSNDLLSLDSSKKSSHVVSGLSLSNGDKNRKGSVVSEKQASRRGDPFSKRDERSSKESLDEVELRTGRME